MEELNAYKEQLASISSVIATLSAESDPALREELETTAGDLQELIDLIESESSNKLENVEDSTKAAWFEELLGQRCFAPFPKNSQLLWNAAIIFEYDLPSKSGDDFIVRVLYSHPLTAAMKPCRSFLAGHCTFDDSCRYSHGEPILFSALEVYEDQDFSLVQKDCLVLVNTGEVWEVARVVEIDEKSLEIAVKLLQTGKDISVTFSQIMPVHASDDIAGSQSNEPLPDTSHSSAIQFTNLKAPKYGNVTIGELGNWEGGGFGLKLMQKMGYKLGEGLGRSSDGIVHAIQASIHPKNKSVDYIMENKKKIRVVGETKKLRERIAREQQKGSGFEADIFAFINQQFKRQWRKLMDGNAIILDEQNDLKKASKESLLTSVLDNEKMIKKLRSKKLKLEQGILRNKDDKRTLEKLQTALNHVCQEINHAEGRQSRIQTEHKSRRLRKDIF